MDTPLTHPCPGCTSPTAPLAEAIYPFYCPRCRIRWTRNLPTATNSQDDHDRCHYVTDRDSP